MRVLIISDIHANLVALETVLAEAKDQWDVMWCLGEGIIRKRNFPSGQT